MRYKAIKCPCGHAACASWHVSPVADTQGVSFTKEQAEAVAKLLNDLDKPAELRQPIGIDEVPF